jgi:hypothetical protein
LVPPGPAQIRRTTGRDLLRKIRTVAEYDYFAPQDRARSPNFGGSQPEIVVVCR